MAKILLDYAFPVTLITGTPSASTGFLKRVCVVATPKSGQEGNVGTMYTCNTMAEVEARTDNTNAQQLFNAGLSQVFILLADDLDVAAAMTTYAGEFFTVLISDDFNDAAITPTAASLTINGDLTFTAVDTGSGGNAITITLADTGTAGSETVTVTGTDIVIGIDATVSTATQIAAAYNGVSAGAVAARALATIAIVPDQGAAAQAAAAEDNLEGGDGLFLGIFSGITGVSSTSAEFAATQAATEDRVAFFTGESNGAKNMFYAFGSMLSNPSNWRNQQYITMPFNDGVGTLGAANSLFDDKVSFVLNDDEFGNRLALFAVGGKAIVAPYILKNLQIDMQSRALNWISLNQPSYTRKEASLLEARLQEDVIQQMYIDRNWIENGTVEISLVQSNFVANGDIEVTEPRALWRVFNELTAV